MFEGQAVKTYSGGKPNYTQPIEQEPVAYLCENAVGHKYFRWKKPQSVFKPIPVYTASPQREWVGLTDEEIADVYGDYMDSLDNWEEEDEWGYERALEAKLKEKNV
jgi:hypothetical protein